MQIAESPKFSSIEGRTIDLSKILTLVALAGGVSGLVRYIRSLDKQVAAQNAFFVEPADEVVDRTVESRLAFSELLEISGYTRRNK